MGLTTTIYSGITQEAFEILNPCYLQETDATPGLVRY